MNCLQNYKQQENFFDIAQNQFDPKKIESLVYSLELEFIHLKRRLNMNPPKILLDFGSGTGRITIFLLKQGFDVYAIDISKRSLRVLKYFYDHHKTKSWGNLTTSTTIPKNILFDGIVGADILHHVNISEQLTKLYNALKPDGIIVFSEPNAWHFPWHIFISCKLSWKIERGIFQCSIPNLKTKFKSAGFKNISFMGHGLIPTMLLDFFPFLSRINALLLGNLPLIKFFSFRLIIFAEK